MFRIVMCVSILLAAAFLLADTGNAQSSGASVRQLAAGDSAKVPLRLPNPFLKNSQNRWGFSSSQKLMAWVFMHRNQLRAVVKPQQSSDSGLAIPLPLMDWQAPQPAASLPGLDYRESSLYVPVNVREYQQYQMGRSRYMPLGNLALAMYLANKLYRRYGYLLRRREQERYRNLVLDDTGIAMLKVLWKTPGLLAPEWYTAFHRTYPGKKVVFLQFRQKIRELQDKYLVNPRTFPDHKIKYYPAISREKLLLKLKEELDQLDAVTQMPRFRQLRGMIAALEG